jgi:putative Holliday junction resolvase
MAASYSWNLTRKFPLSLEEPYRALPIQTLVELSGVLSPTDRLIGIDYGPSHLGLAISDWWRKNAYPYKSFHSYTISQWIVDMKTIHAKEHLKKWIMVMGYPLNLEGEEGPMCPKVLQFLHKIHARLPLDHIILWDERYSTLSTCWKLKEWCFIKASERKRLIDSEAAAYILQDCLDALSYYREKGIV